MKQSEIVEALRAIGVINSWDLLKRFAGRGEDIAITYHRESAGRGGRPARTVVWSTIRATDPTAHWQDHKSKTFSGKRATSWEKALAWACLDTRTQPHEWSKNPVDPRSGLVLEVVRDRALDAINRGRP